HHSIDKSNHWGDGGTGPQRNDLAAGTYSVTATDATGCANDGLEVTIGSICDCLPPVVANIVITETSCGQAEGAAEIAVLGDPTAYTYSWFPNSGSANGLGNARTGLTAGVYSVTITDPLLTDCFTTTTFAIGNLDGPEPTSINTTTADCGLANGTATLLPDNYNYVWLFDNVATNVRDDLAAGIYEVIVINPEAPDCPNIATVEIEELNTLSLTAVIEAQSTCGNTDGQVRIEVTGGGGNYFYHWSDGVDLTTNQRDDLSGGTYQVRVEDQQTACEAIIVFTLTDAVAGANVIVLPSEIILACAGDTNGLADFTLSLFPGFVEPATTQIQDGLGNTYVNGNLGAGDYCLVVFDGNDCLAGSACFAVVEPEAIEIDLTVSPVTCDEEGSIGLTVSGGNGGFAFDWADLPGPFNPQNRMGLLAGPYSVTITDFAGCTAQVNTINIAETCNPMEECTPPIIENVLTLGANCG
ncbi:MAG: hypothetical protein AAGD05_18660, partial [Bacteroidota bacterium]